MGNPGITGAGRLIRHNQGEWIKGYLRNLENISNMVAELWGIRNGLTLTLELGVQYLHVETDSMDAIDMTQKYTYFSPFLWYD